MDAQEIERVKLALWICADETKNCDENDCPYCADDNCQRDIARDALEAIEQLLDYLGREAMIWHKWPEEKPEPFKVVLGRFKEKNTTNTRECYMTYTEKFCFPGMMGQFFGITEWAEMPE